VIYRGILGGVAGGGALGLEACHCYAAAGLSTRALAPRPQAKATAEQCVGCGGALGLGAWNCYAAAGRRSGALAQGPSKATAEQRLGWVVEVLWEGLKGASCVVARGLAGDGWVEFYWGGFRVATMLLTSLG
jgi:hypothetical protein